MVPCLRSPGSDKLVFLVGSETTQHIQGFWGWPLLDPHVSYCLIAHFAGKQANPLDSPRCSNCVYRKATTSREVDQLPSRWCNAAGVRAGTSRYLAPLYQRNSLYISVFCSVLCGLAIWHFQLLCCATLVVFQWNTAHSERFLTTFMATGVPLVLVNLYKRYSNKVHPWKVELAGFLTRDLRYIRSTCLAQVAQSKPGLFVQLDGLRACCVGVLTRTLSRSPCQEICQRLVRIRFFFFFSAPARLLSLLRLPVTPHFCKPCQRHTTLYSTCFFLFKDSTDFWLLVSWLFPASLLLRFSAFPCLPASLLFCFKAFSSFSAPLLLLCFSASPLLLFCIPVFMLFLASLLLCFSALPCFLCSSLLSSFRFS